MQKRVDGLLVMYTESHLPSADILNRYPSIPVVVMDWAPFEGRGEFIQDNALLGGELATQHLIDSGYTRIACIAGPQDKTPARMRLEGYRSAMTKSGLDILPGYIVNGDFEFQGGYNGMVESLALETLPEAVFTRNVAMAVIGYDDVEQACYLTPRLSIIHQPKYALGELAIDTLIHRLSDPDASQQTLVLTPELVVQGSV